MSKNEKSLKSNFIINTLFMFYNYRRITNVFMKGFRKTAVSIALLVLSFNIPVVTADQLPEIQTNVKFHTRSIVACDPIEDACGIAVVSFTSGVPAVIPVGEENVIVANQGFLPSYTTSKNIIENIKTYGMSAMDALNSALAYDPLMDFRQLGVATLDPSVPSGVSVANFTGNTNVTELPETCSVVGETYSVQASLQTSASVCSAMSTAFENTQGSLAVRLLKAIVDSSLAGNDARGEFSATIKVYSGSWALSDVTPLSADANVDRSKNWEKELEFGVYSYLATLVPPDPRNLVKLKKRLYT